MFVPPALYTTPPQQPLAVIVVLSALFTHILTERVLRLTATVSQL